MTAPISNDLRIRIVEARAQERQSYDQLAERFGVGRATVSRVLLDLRTSAEPAEKHVTGLDWCANEAVPNG